MVLLHYIGSLVSSYKYPDLLFKQRSSQRPGFYCTPDSLVPSPSPDPAAPLYFTRKAPRTTAQPVGTGQNRPSFVPLAPSQRSIGYMIPPPKLPHTPCVHPSSPLSLLPSSSFQWVVRRSRLTNISFIPSTPSLSA